MLDQYPRSVKYALVVLFVAALAVVVFIILAQYGVIDMKKAQPEPVKTPVVVKPGVTVPVPKAEQPGDTASGTVTGQPAEEGPVPEGYISSKQAQEEFKAVQQSLSEGTTSMEEAQKQALEISKKMAPPPIPDELKNK